MRSITSMRVAVGLLAGLCAGAASASEQITIPRLDRAPRLEEFLDMRGPDDLRSAMVHIDRFTQREPEDGKPATQRTDAYLGYDEKNIYVVFMAFDDEPTKVRAHRGRRENVFGDDIVEIQLDTFLDQQRAYSFIVNPLGIQFDALWTEGQQFDGSWDTVWQSRGELTPQGYVVLISIPFRSLRFPPDAEQVWGVVLARDVQRTDEETFWPPISTRVEGRLNQAATMDGLSGITGGGNSQVIPYVTARNFEALSTIGEPSLASDSFDPDVGVDAKIVFDDRLALDLTANPDFSQVESDLPQVTVNERFEVFFPEKRPFFLENANFFQMPFNLLFTRRIADPRAGARLSGRVGKYTLAAMLIDDESPGESVPSGDPLAGEAALFKVLRFGRDLARQSSVGMIYTEHELAGTNNRVLGVDSRIKLTDNWVAQLQAVASRSADGVSNAVEDQAFNAQFDHSGRRYGAHIHYNEVGPQFETRAGFVSRRDTRNLHTQQSWTFWPEGKRLISWSPSLFLVHLEDHEGERLEARVETQAQFEFRRSTSLTVFDQRGEDRLRPQDLQGIVIPLDPLNPPLFMTPIDFDITRSGLRFRTQFASGFDLNTEFSVGQGINFVPAIGALPSAVDSTLGRVELSVRPTTPTRISLNYFSTRLTDRALLTGVLSNHIGRVRFDWQVSRRWSLRAITEYETTQVETASTRLEPLRRLNGDLLATYLVNPWTALYIGYNTNYRNRELILDPLGNQIVNTGTNLNRDGRQLFVKYSHLFQL